MKNQSLYELKNIGKTVALKLQEIGVTNAVELKNLGSSNAYQALMQKNANQHLPVCYYLYSLEGALQDRDWRDFSEQEKAELRRAAGLPK